MYAGLISSSPIIGAKAKVKGIGPKDDGIFYRSDNHIIANTAGTGGKDLVKQDLGIVGNPFGIGQGGASAGIPGDNTSNMGTVTAAVGIIHLCIAIGIVKGKGNLFRNVNGTVSGFLLDIFIKSFEKIQRAFVVQDIFHDVIFC